MKTRNRTKLLGLAVALLLLATRSSTVAAPATAGGGEAAGIRLAGTVTSQITYQGRLEDAQGNPLNGPVHLLFRLWNAESEGQQVGADMAKFGTPVTNGLFTVQLAVPHDAFNGQGLWLEINVAGQKMTPRQPLLPVPYALSLRPGATISSPGPDTLHVGNEAGGHAIEAWSRNNVAVVATNGSTEGPPPSGMRGVHATAEGVAVYAQGGHTGVYAAGTNFGVKAESSGGDGVTGESTAPAKAGVYGHNTNGVGVRGRSEKSDGVVGWTGSADGSGVFGHSDAGVGVSGLSQGSHGVLGVTQSTLPGSAGVRARNDGGGPAISSQGDLYVTGALRGDIGPAGGGPFPRPAWDSGWQSMSQGQKSVLTHGLGGDPDAYVVDVQFRQPSGIHHTFYGGNSFFKGDDFCDRGGYWDNLTDQSIQVRRFSYDLGMMEVRVRIWVVE